MLRNNLRARLGGRVDEVLQAASLSPDARAEQLTVSQFAKLFQLSR